MKHPTYKRIGVSKGREVEIPWTRLRHVSPRLMQKISCLQLKLPTHNSGATLFLTQKWSLMGTKVSLTQGQQLRTLDPWGGMIQRTLPTGAMEISPTSLSPSRMLHWRIQRELNRRKKRQEQSLRKIPEDQV